MCSLLKAEPEFQATQANAVHIMNSFFFQQYSNELCYEDVRKWQRKLDLVDSRFLLVPVNLLQYVTVYLDIHTLTCIINVY